MELSRLCGCLAAAAPAYLAYSDSGTLAAIVAGIVGWFVGPVFFRHRAVRRTVGISALVGAAVAYALCALGALITMHHPVAGLEQSQLARYLTRDAVVLAASAGYAAAGLGCAGAWIWRLVARRR